MRRAVRALLAVAAVGLVLPVASVAHAQEAQKASLDVVAQTPTVAPEGVFILALNVRDAPAGARIEWTFYKVPVADRPAFNITLFGKDLGDEHDDMPTKEVDDLSRIGSTVRRAEFGISLVHEKDDYVTFEKGLRGPGAYPIDVRLVSEDGAQLDRLITYLVRLPEDLDAIQPLRAAMVFDIHAPPAVAPDGTTKLDAEALDRIAALGVALQSHTSTRETLVATPETIEALAHERGRPRALLQRLQEVMPYTQVVDRPYVDVPVSAWIDAGMRDQLNLQRQRGNAVLTEHLKRPDRTTWVATTPDLTPEAAAELWESGFTRFVLPEAAFSPPAPDESGPTTSARPFDLATRVDAPVQAVAIDSSLSYALTREMHDPELQALQLVAQLAVIQGEAPDASRGVVFGPVPGLAIKARVVSNVLDLLEDDPLVQTSSVGEVFDEVATARDGGDGPAVTRELTPRGSTDLGAYPTLVREVQARMASFLQLVPRADDLVASWQQRLLVSGAAELDPAVRDSYLAVIQAGIDQRIGKIEAPARQTVTLTSREGVIPFSVRNRLTDAVRLVVQLDGGSRLEFPDGTNQRTTVVPPGVKQIGLPVRTRTPGVIPVSVRVTSPDGGLLIATSRVTVRSTAVSGIGYVLSVGAAVFLLVWWFRHWRRARRERRLDVTATGVAGS